MLMERMEHLAEQRKAGQSILKSRPAGPNLEAVRQRILEQGDLPTLPSIALEVARLTANPMTGMSEIVRIIRNDPPLTVRILRVANSAFYGMSRQIESLNMALVVLGMREVSNLVTCIAVLRTFPPVPGDHRFDRTRFWEHSAGCGELARVIANRLHIRLHGIEFTAGLLHDIGKIVFDQYYHADFIQALEHAEREKVTELDAERAIIGADHAEIGAWLAERWCLPPAIVEAILYHHDPARAPENVVLSAVVHLADRFSRAFLNGETRTIRPDSPLAMDPAWEVLAHHNPEIISLDVVRFCGELEESAQRAREFIRLALE